MAEDIELAENVSIAMLTVLETLGPAERAVFVLREVFETPFEEIAEAVGKSPAAVRQIAHRAREHVAARRPRMRVDPAEQRAVVEKFLAAVATGDVQGLMAVLAPDVVVTTDGGGVVQAARKPIVGADKAVSFLARAAQLPGFSVRVAWFNGMPGVRFEIGGETTAVSLLVENGLISRVYAIRNPDKLGGLEKEAELRR